MESFHCRFYWTVRATASTRKWSSQVQHFWIQKGSRVCIQCLDRHWQLTSSAKRHPAAQMCCWGGWCRLDWRSCTWSSCTHSAGDWSHHSTCREWRHQLVHKIQSSQYLSGVKTSAVAQNTVTTVPVRSEDISWCTEYNHHGTWH